MLLKLPFLILLQLFSVYPFSMQPCFTYTLKVCWLNFAYKLIWQRFLFIIYSVLNSIGLGLATQGTLTEISLDHFNILLSASHEIL